MKNTYLLKSKKALLCATAGLLSFVGACTAQGESSGFLSGSMKQDTVYSPTEGCVHHGALYQAYDDADKTCIHFGCVDEEEPCSAELTQKIEAGGCRLSDFLEGVEPSCTTSENDSINQGDETDANPSEEP